MTSPLTRSTGCRVELVTPEHVRLVFDAAQTDSALLAVSTHNDIGEACGAFSLTFAPVSVQGRTYDQLIPLRSLVTIFLRAGDGSDTDTETVVMVGLTEDHGIIEDYSRGQPQRVVTITGRSMALVFLDMALRHYPLLEDHVQGTLSVGDHYFNLFIPTNFLEPDLDPCEALRAVLVYFLGVKSRIPVRQRAEQVEIQQEVQQAHAAQPDVPVKTLTQRATEAKTGTPDPRLRTQVQVQSGPTSRETFLTLVDEQAAWMDAHPGASQTEIQAHYIALVQAQGGGAATLVQAPPAVTQAAAAAQAQGQQTQAHVPHPQNTLMNLQLPGRSLADLLDLNDDTWTLFDTDIRVPIGKNTPYAVTLWNYLLQFVDPVFQEFFTRVEDGVVKVVFRAKPFLDDHEHPTFTGSRFIDSDPTCTTLPYTRDAWEAEYLGGQLRRQTAQVYNTFLAMPLEAGVMRSLPSYEWIFVPFFLDDPTHPSYIAKYGLRELKDSSPYLSLKKLDDPSPTEAQRGRVERIGRQWSQKAAAWYGLGSEMYAGVMTVLGNPRLNVGHRLLYADERGEREGYIEGIDHMYDCRTGRYLTSLKVTRLWYLRGLVDERGAPGATDETVVSPEEVTNAP